MKRIVKWKLSIQRSHIWLVITGILLLFGAAGIYWLNNSFAPSDAALRAFSSDAAVTTSFQNYYRFTPTGPSRPTGILIYPGGKVQPLAYATLARKLAEAGYFVAIVPMPFNLAILDATKGKMVMDDQPTISKWLVVGHSLGGVAASSLVKSDIRVLGLAMLASVTDPNVDLSASSVKVISLIGTQDGLISVSEIQENLSRLPDTAKLIELKGGNHSYFGDYGLQPNDNPATISWEEQQFVTAQEILKLAKLLD